MWIIHLLTDDIEVFRVVNGDVVPPFELDRNEFGIRFQAAHSISAASQHLFVLRNVKVRSPGCLVKDVVDAIEGKCDLTGLMQSRQVLGSQTGAVADQEATLPCEFSLVQGQPLSIFCAAEMGLLMRNYISGLHTGSHAGKYVHALPLFRDILRNNLCIFTFIS